VWERLHCLRITDRGSRVVCNGGISNADLLTTDAAHFTINSVAMNPTRTWYNWVMRDPGLFNGILSTVALYMHSHIGIPVVKEDILYHRGETMKIINQRLHNMAGVDASVLIGVIATILSFEVSSTLA
jgi:hypothetical protein